jgi:nicotinamide mononucleotide adenylyltransferase
METKTQTIKVAVALDGIETAMQQVRELNRLLEETKRLADEVGRMKPTADRSEYLRDALRSALNALNRQEAHCDAPCVVDVRRMIAESERRCSNF